MDSPSVAGDSPVQARPRVGFFRPAIGFVFLVFLIFYLVISTLPGKSVVTEDELWAATLANLSFFKSIVFILRFDNHPPLYYMQLNLWALAGQSDRWLQMNSAFWLLATGAIVLRLVQRRSGAMAGVIAAGLTLSSPILVDYGLELRMYSFLGFLTVLGLLAAEPLLESFARAGTAPRRQWLAVFLACLAIIYSFAIGALIIVGHFVYGVLTGWRAGVPSAFYRRWLGLHVGLAVLALPVVANSVLRGAGHALSPDGGIVASTVTELAIGTHADQLGLWTLPALIVLGVGFVGALALAATARNLLIAYVLLPLVLVFAVSHVLTPIWLTRAFVFAVPVFYVAIGRALGPRLARSALPGRVIVAALAAAVICLQAATGYRNALVPKEPDYAALAAAYRRQMAAGDCVVAFQGLDAFWGMARYFAGPDWGDALAIQAPPAKRWVQIMAATPPGLSSRLGWVPQSDRFDHDGIHLISGDPADLAQTCLRVFLIGNAPGFAALPADRQKAPILAASGWVSLRGPIAAESFQ
jgi:mannosyltransferase